MHENASLVDLFLGGKPLFSILNSGMFQMNYKLAFSCFWVVLYSRVILVVSPVHIMHFCLMVLISINVTETMPWLVCSFKFDRISNFLSSSQKILKHVFWKFLSRSPNPSPNHLPFTANPLCAPPFKSNKCSLCFPYVLCVNFCWSVVELWSVNTLKENWLHFPAAINCQKLFRFWVGIHVYFLSPWWDLV